MIESKPAASISSNEPHGIDEIDSAEKNSATQKSTWISVAVNLCLTAGQAIAGFASGSQGLVADAVHSLSDLVADFVVLVAVKHSKKDADEDHPYGHHRFENAASLFLGALLLAVGVGMAWSAASKLQQPELIPRVGNIALYVALAALAAKEMLFRYMLSVAERVKSSLLVANAWHARSDAASSLVVSIGIVGNMCGMPLLDPVAALIVGFMVGKMGWNFLWSAMHDLTDRSADTQLISAIRADILATPGVRGVHDLRTRKMGDMLLVDAHLEIDGTLSVAQGHDIASEARTRVLSRHAVLDVMTHVDPV